MLVTSPSSQTENALLTPSQRGFGSKYTERSRALETTKSYTYGRITKCQMLSRLAHLCLSGVEPAGLLLLVCHGWLGVVSVLMRTLQPRLKQYNRARTRLLLSPVCGTTATIDHKPRHVVGGHIGVRT